MKSIKILLFAIFLAIVGSEDISNSVNVIYTGMIVAVKIAALVAVVVGLTISDKK